MTRQEVAISLADINMMNKKITSAILLNNNISEVIAQFDLALVPNQGDEILNYMKSNPLLTKESRISSPIHQEP